MGDFRCVIIGVDEYNELIESQIKGKYIIEEKSRIIEKQKAENIELKKDLDKYKKVVKTNSTFFDEKAIDFLMNLFGEE